MGACAVKRSRAILNEIEYLLDQLDEFPDRKRRLASAYYARRNIPLTNPPRRDYGDPMT